MGTPASMRASVPPQTVAGLSPAQTAAQSDPTVVHDVDIAKGYRDAVSGAGAPAAENWND